MKNSAPLLRPSARLLLLAGASTAGIVLGCALSREAEAAAITLNGGNVPNFTNNTDWIVFVGGSNKFSGGNTWVTSTATASSVANASANTFQMGQNDSITFWQLNNGTTGTAGSMTQILSNGQTSGGTITITGSGTYNGLWTISNGSLAMTGSGSISGATMALAAAPASLNISGSTGNNGLAGLSMASGSSLTLGSKTLTISGNVSGGNTLAGNITQTASGNNIGTIALSTSGTTASVTASATATGVIFAPAANTSLDLSGYIGATKTIGGLSGGGAVLIGNSGTVTALTIVAPVLTGTTAVLPSFTGTIYNTGTSASTRGLTLSAASTPTTGQIAGQAIDSTQSFTGAITVNSGATLAVGQLSYISASLAGNAANLAETATLAITNNGLTGTTTNTLSNTISGNGYIALSSGANLTLTSAATVSNIHFTTVAGTQLDLTAIAASKTIGGLSGGGNVLVGNNTLVIADAPSAGGVNSSALPLFSGNIYSSGTSASTGGLTISATSTPATGSLAGMAINGSLTYTGATTINTGSTLALLNGGSIASSLVTVNAGGTLMIGGAGASAETAYIKGLAGGGSVVFNGVSGANDVLYISGPGSGSTATFTGTMGSGTTGTLFGDVQLIGQGTQNLSGATLQYSGATTINSGMTLSLATLSQLNSSLTSATGGLTMGETGYLALTSATSNTLSSTVSGTGYFVLSSGASLTVTSGASVATTHFTIASGASVDLTGIASSAKTIGGLSGGGNVLVGNNTLLITDVAATGTISSSAMPLFSGNLYSTGTSASSGGLTVSVSGSQPTSGQIAGQAIGSTLTYTGATTINTGATLGLLNNANIAASSGVTVNAGGTLAIGGAGGSAETGYIRGLAGSGNVVLYGVSGANDVLSIAAAGTTFSGVISGAFGNVALTGAGTQTFTGTQTYAGSTTVNSGTTLSISGMGQLASSLNGSGMVLNQGGTLALTSATSSTLAGSISGTGTVFIVSGATLNIVSTATVGNLIFSAPTGATLDVSGLAAASGTVGGLSGGGTVLTGNNTLVISDAPTTGSYAALPVFTGQIYSTGTSASAGGLTVGAASAPSGGQIAGQAFSGNTLTFTGATVVTSGATLGLFGGASIAASSGITVNTGATLVVGLGGAAAETGYIRGLAGGGSVVLNGVSGFADTLALTANNTSFSGAISGSFGNLALSGGGTQTFTGTQTYAGSTVVNSGATLSLGGLSQIAASVTGSGGGLTLNEGGTLALTAAGANSLANTVSGSGVFSLSSGVSLTVTSAATVTNQHFNAASGATLDVSGLLGASRSIGGLSGAGNVLMGNNTLVITDLANPGGVSTLPVFTGNLYNTGTSASSGGLTVSVSGSQPTSGQIAGQAIGSTLTYTGATTINTGATLALLAGGNIAASSGVTVNAGGTLMVGSGGGTAETGYIRGLAGGGSVVLNGTSGGFGTLSMAATGTTFSGAISGTYGNIAITGSGTQTFTGTQTYAGTTTIGSGATLALGALSQIATTSGITLTEPGTLALTSATTHTLGTSVSGSGYISIVSGATLSVTSAASVSNVHFTAPSGSTLNLTGVASVGGSNGGLSGGGTVLVGNNTLIITDVPATGGYATLPVFSGQIYGTGTSASTGGLTVNASAAPTGGQIAGQVLSGATQTFTGATVVNSGATLGLYGGASIAASSGLTVASGATLVVGSGGSAAETGYVRDLAGGGSVVLNGTSGFPATLSIAANGSSFSGVISGLLAGANANVAITGSGTQSFTGANTYAGTTTIASGAALALNSGGSISNSAAIVVSGATLLVANGQTGQSSSIGGLSGAGTVIITNSAGTANTLTVNANGASFAGNFSATNGRLVVAGTGTQTFTGTLNQTGTTTVNSGAGMALNSGASAAGSAFTVAAGGTLSIGAAGESGLTSSIGGLSGGGALSIANSATTPNTLNIAATGGSYSGSIGASNGRVAITGSGTQSFTGTQNYTGSTTVNAGATLAVTTLSLISQSLTNSAATVAAGGTLAVAQSSTLGSTIAGSGVIQMGSGGVLTVTSAANISNLIVKPVSGAVADLTSLVATSGKTIGGLSGSGNVLIGNTANLVLSAAPVNGLAALPVFDGRIYASGTTATSFALTINAASTPGAGQYAGQILGSLQTLPGTTTIGTGATLGLSGIGAGVTGSMVNNGTLAIGLNGGYQQKVDYTQASGATLLATIYQSTYTLAQTLLDMSGNDTNSLAGRLFLDFTASGLTPSIGDFYPLIYSAQGWQGDFASFYTSNDPSNACVAITRHPATLTPPAGAGATGAQAGPWAWNDVWQCGSLYFAEVMDPTRTYLAIQVVSANDVPEPGTLALLGAGLLGLGYARRRRGARAAA